MRVGAALLSAIALAEPAAAAERPWLEAKGPNFTVIGNAGEKDVRRLVWQLEQMRAIFEKVLPWAKLRPGRPMLGILARDEATFRSLAPGFFEKKASDSTTAVFVSGRDRSYIVVRGDVRQDSELNVNPYFTVYFGYVHLALDASMDRPLPLWLMRGLSGVFGNTVVRDKDVLIGPPVPWFYRTLGERGRLPVRTLLTADRSSPAYRSEDTRAVFDAQSWLITHWMIFGNGGQNLAQFTRFMQLYQSKPDQDAALQGSFGGVEAIEHGLGDYLTTKLIDYRKADVDVGVKLDSFATRPLSELDAKAACASLHVAMGRPVEAKALVDGLLKSDAKLAAAQDVLGLLFDSTGTLDEAAAAYARAVELGSESFYSHYRHASLSWKGNPSKEQLVAIRDAAKMSVVLNPEYPRSQILLADASGALGDTAAALAAARRAVELQPGEPWSRMALARALRRAGQTAEAQQEAGRALAQAQDDEARNAARELLDRLAAGER